MQYKRQIIPKVGRRGIIPKVGGTKVRQNGGFAKLLIPVVFVKQLNKTRIRTRTLSFQNKALSEVDGCCTYTAFG